MSFSLTETDDDTMTVKVMSTEYTTESDGHRYTEPIVHCFCRDGDGRRKTVEVEGFHPHFYIPESEFLDKKEQILNGNTIRRIEVRPEAIPDSLEHNSFVQEMDGLWQTLLDEPVIRIVTIEPEHVGELRDYFDDHYEADVFFTDRFAISNGIDRYMTIPSDRDRVHVDEIESADDGPDVRPKMVTVDIEVWSGDGFPEPEYADHPVTSIVAHDSYTDEYRGWMLRPWKDDNTWPDTKPDWETPDGVDASDFSAEVFTDEGVMLQDFIDYIVDADPDLLSGWNSSKNDNGAGFDYPYIINRCKNINVWGVEDLSPLGQTFTTSRETAVAKGRQMFDMMQAYKKTQIHEKRNYTLDYISQEELGYGKEDVAEYDEGWLHEPVEFMRYNIRDVQAVIDIEQSKSIIEMYEHIRSISGAGYSDISDSNIGIIDPLVLRYAYRQETVLPTSTVPEVKHYWGAWVESPSPGKHENVVYPDLASLYPNLFFDMNASQETIVGFEEDLQRSQYTTEDCIEMYVDPRDESVKKDVDEPERVPFYALKPEVEESFVRELIGDLIDMKYEYKKDEYPDEQYGAVKRITNSVYGVFGDSDTYGTGFRLFDWRIAEAITLAGRDVITHTADTFEKRARQIGYTDAEVIYGDSVPADEPVIVKDSGSVDIVPIADVESGQKVWSDDGFTEVMNVIKKPNRKKTYTVRSQTGLVHTTEDHGLLRDDGTEATPEEIDKGDELLHRDVADVDVDSDSTTVSKEEAWLLGLFCAEGSAGSYETSYNSRCKNQLKISNQETELLERAIDAFESEFSFEMNLHDDTESSNVWNIKPYDNEEGEIPEMVARFRKWCYTDTGEKKVPKRILNTSEETIRAFLNGFHDGDGHMASDSYLDERNYDELWSKSKVLMQGIVFCLRQIGVDVSLSYRRNHDAEYYRTRCPSFRKKTETSCQKIEQYGYDGEYVYDLETSNHHFAAGIGSMVVHNTDSCVCTFPSADGSYAQSSVTESEKQAALTEAELDYDEWADTPMGETLVASVEAAEYVNATYDQFMSERFNMDEQDMEVEIESYAESMFLRSKKKRYAEWIRWDEGDLEDEVSLTGFEAVRSDSSTVTERVQTTMLEKLLRSDDPYEVVTEYLSEERQAILDGDVSLEELGIPKKISSDPQDYGWTDKPELSQEDCLNEPRLAWSQANNRAYKFWTAAPNVRGVRYANQYVDGENISGGDKPLLFKISSVDCGCEKSESRALGESSNDTHPSTYQYDIALNTPSDVSDTLCELGDEVDSVCVEDVDNLPDCLEIDYEEMCEKGIKSPNERIIEDMGWSWDDVTMDSTQTGLEGFM